MKNPRDAANVRGLGPTGLESNMDNGTRSRRLPQSVALNLIQQGESYVYALVTRDGAIKMGVSQNLAQRKNNIFFGGFHKFLAFTPGDYWDEQVIHASLPHDLRIAGRREYYYPLYEYVLPPINEMRSKMGIEPLRRRDLPRTGYWAARLPVADPRVSWPWPKPWQARAAS